MVTNWLKPVLISYTNYHLNFRTGHLIASTPAISVSSISLNAVVTVRRKLNVSARDRTLKDSKPLRHNMVDEWNFLLLTLSSHHERVVDRRSKVLELSYSFLIVGTLDTLYHQILV